MQYSKSPYERPLKHLKQFSKDFHMHWDHISDLYIKSERDWPDWCFFPYEPALAGYFEAHYRIPHTTRADWIAKSLQYSVLFSVLCNWRYTQSVYRIDETLLQELYKVETSRLPTQLLTRLTEGAFYIETPGLTFEGDQQYGMFVMLDYHLETPLLRLLVDTERALQPLELALTDQPLEQTLAESYRCSMELGLPASSQIYQSELDKVYGTAFNLLQYICSDSAEFLGTDRPQMIKPKKTKQGLRLFAPKRPQAWYLGYETGKQIRAAQEAVARGDKKIIPHIRRAHWHSYWTGPMKGERKLIVKFLAPIIVGAEA